MHRGIWSLIEELEAIDWYQQRADVTGDEELRAVLIHNKNEEIEHAMKFFHFILDRGGRVRLQSIAQPPVDCDSPLDVFEKALAGEQRVTGLIDNLNALAVREQDFAGQNFLNWFVEEQVEEEKIATQVIETLKLIGGDKPALVMLDRELANRSAGGE